jgi:hypothetical protein
MRFTRAMDSSTGELDMDGTRRETGLTREVKRSFVGVRLDPSIMTVAYERVLPWMRGRNGTKPAHRACGEGAARNAENASMPRRATGA